MATALEAEGIILRKYFLRETSYILVVFTRKFGKIRGVLKGVRDPYPQFAGNFEIFTKCQMLFYKKKRSFDLITRCEALDFFLPVRKDIERLTYANYFIELVDVVAGDHDADEELYDTLLECLQLLATRSSAKRISRIFELKLLKNAGMAPRLDECVECGTPGLGNGRYSIKDGGIKCGRCAAGDGSSMKVSPGTLKFMRKITETPISRTAQIKVSREVGIETESILKRFVQYHTGRQIKSLKFLKEIEKAGIC